MKCPVCKDVSLVIAERQGIEIDYCPECRGVWLDRGELDKLIEKSSQQVSNQSQSYDQPVYREDRYHSDYKNSHKRKRKGLLGELFDFD